MSSFGGLYVTRAGRIVQSKMAEGKMLNFIGVGIGNGEVSGDLEKVTELSNQLEEIKITDIKTIGEKAIFSFNFTNKGFLANGFYWRELGLYVEDPDTKSKILYAYGNAGNDAEYIPDYNSNDIISKKIDLVLIFENTNNIIVQLDTNAMFTTSDEVDKKIEETVFKNYYIQIDENIQQNTDYILPATYTVGKDNLEIIVEGVLLIKNENYIEVGNEGEQSDIIKFLWNVDSGYAMLVKVRGQSLKIYTKEEAIAAVKQVYIDNYGSIEGVSVNVSAYTADKNYFVTVSNSQTTATIAFYMVNRFTLEVEER